MDDQLLGFLIALFGGVLSIGGLNGQKWALEVSGGVVGWRWYLALALYTGGQIAQMVAYAYGTQTLVAATSNLSLVTNVVFASAIFGEPFAWRPVRDWRRHGVCGALLGWDLAVILLVIAGTFCVAVTAPVPSARDLGADLPTMERLFGGALFLGFVSVTAAVVAASLVQMLAMRMRKAAAAEKDKLSDDETGGGGGSGGGGGGGLLRNGGALVFSAAASGTAALSVSLSKVMALLLRESFSHRNQFTTPVAWVFAGLWLVLILANLALLNLGLSSFDSSVIIPMYYTMSTTWVIVLGEVLFRSWRHFTPLRAAGFAAGLGVSLLGVHMLADAGADIAAEEEEEEEEGGGEEEEEDEKKEGGLPPPSPEAPPLLTVRTPPRAHGAARRRGSQFGGALNIRTRATRASSIDILVSQWDLAQLRERQQRQQQRRQAAAAAGGGEGGGDTRSRRSSLSYDDRGDLVAPLGGSGSGPDDGGGGGGAEEGTKQRPARKGRSKAESFDVASLLREEKQPILRNHGQR